MPITDSSPLTFLNVILYSILTVVVLSIIGLVIAFVIEKLFFKKASKGLPLRTYLDTLSSFILYVGLGSLGLIFTLSVLLFFPGGFPLKAYCTLSFYLAIGAYILFQRGGKHKRTLLQSLKKLRTKNFGFSLLLLILSFYALLHYIFPILGLYSYPNTDSLSYAFASNIILETGRIPFLPFSYPYARLKIHTIAAGLPVFSAFFHLFYRTTMAKTYLFLPQFLRGLTPLFLYSVITLMLKEKPQKIRRSCGIGGLLVGIFSFSQYRFFKWAGVSDSLGYNLVLTLFSVYLLLKFHREEHAKHKTIRDSFKLWLGKYFVFFSFSIFMIGFTCVYTIFLFSSLIFGDLIISWFNREERKKAPTGAFILVILFIYLGSILLPSLLPPSQLKTVLNAKLNPLHAREVILSDPLRQSQGEYKLLFQLRIQNLPILIENIISVAFLSIFGIIGMVTFKKDGTFFTAREKALIVSSLVLVFFSQNNPYGVYYIPLPAGRALSSPTRIYHQFTIFFSIVSGIGIAQGSLVGWKGFRKYFSQIKQNEKINLLTKKQKKGIFFLLFLFPIFLFYAKTNANAYQEYMLDLRDDAAITQEDMKAFKWISQHIPKDKRFFVSQVDAGKWLYVTLGYTVIPHPNLPLKENHSRSLRRFEDLLIAGIINDTTTALLKGYGIDYIYVGQRGQKQFLDFPNQFNRTALNATFPISYHKGNVRIFNVSSITTGQ